jgi:hypothetical protein
MERPFYILLTVQLVTILGKWPTGCTILLYIFISILCMFRATPCSSSGESVVSLQPLVYVTMQCVGDHFICRSERRFLSDLHTKWSPTQSDIYQRLYWYDWFSWWWARGCSKHVENWNKYIEKNCASSSSFTKSHGEACLFHKRIEYTLVGSSVLLSIKLASQNTNKLI